MGMAVMTVNYTYSSVDLSELAQSLEIKDAIAALQDKKTVSV